MFAKQRQSNGSPNVVLIEHTEYLSTNFYIALLVVVRGGEPCVQEKDKLMQSWCANDNKMIIMIMRKWNQIFFFFFLNSLTGSGGNSHRPSREHYSKSTTRLSDYTQIQFRRVHTGFFNVGSVRHLWVTFKIHKHWYWTLIFINQLQ